MKGEKDSMGAINFFKTAEGESAGEAFDSLVEYFTREAGEDEYNGTISTTQLCGSPHKIAEKYTKTALKKAVEYAKKDSYGQKWESRSLDLGIVKYVVVSASRKKKAHPQKKFRMGYILITMDGDGRWIPIRAKVYDSKSKADEAAIYMALHSDEYHIRVGRIMYPEGNPSGVNVVTDVEKTTKVYKSRPKHIPKGAVLKEIHMWGFYGWAAE